MSELISDPRYWARRLREARAKGVLHEAVFKVNLQRWREIEDRHREILKARLSKGTSVLDCGCGWGRLLTLVPETWAGAYVGVDLSPDFVNLARKNFPSEDFVVGDLRDLSLLTPYTLRYMGKEDGRFDLAVLISVRPMIRRHLGDEVWAQMEAQIRGRAEKILYLEYDPEDGGSLE